MTTSIRHRRASTLLLTTTLLLSGAACTRQPEQPDPSAASVPQTTSATRSTSATAPRNGIESLEPEVLAEYPHDRQAHTQGVEVRDGVVLESTGQVGHSSLRAVEMTTGKVVHQVQVPEPLYAMGIATVPGVGIWQLTWKDGIAILREPNTFVEIRRVRIPGQGWGACFDGTRLITSDGMDRLQLRDPATFERQGEIRVTRSDYTPVGELNELECVDGAVWASVWQRQEAVRIDPATGQVTGVADLRRLHRIERPTGPEDLLNGLAAIPGTNGEFLVFGKHFGQTFRVRWHKAKP
ncbi:glutaminyl-peptide cyclotransferase [Crossiella equi]|uniref:Glutaminyl-peptide cyclotransferase n=1 Tax=Crossiella equi TaxID=130796 RepID=A0ABS5AM78_9PSEU|nr:glutaminyl-peptide cyclotransferase [Crossiella equi]MBP2477679.1 glutaminyl-peptide cyclotransferase [Crossiella equi]